MRKRKLVELIPANFMGKRLTKGELQRISDRIDYLASMIDIWCPKLEHLNIDAAMEELDGWIEVLDHSTSQRSMGLNTYFHARNVRHTPVRAKLSIIDGGRWIGFPSRQSEAKLRVVS